MTAEEIKEWPATKLLTEFEERAREMGVLDSECYLDTGNQRCKTCRGVFDKLNILRTEVHNRMRGARHVK